MNVTTFKYLHKDGAEKSGKVFHTRLKPDATIFAVYGDAMNDQGCWDIVTKPLEKSALELEWETAKAANPNANRCGHHDRTQTPWQRCFRPENHPGDHLV